MLIEVVANFDLPVRAAYPASVDEEQTNETEDAAIGATTSEAYLAPIVAFVTGGPIVPAFANHFEIQVLDDEVTFVFGRTPYLRADDIAKMIETRTLDAALVGSVVMSKSFAAQFMAQLTEKMNR